MPGGRHRPRERPPSPDDWIKVRILGEGGEGTTTLIKNTRTGQYAARKVSDHFEMVNEDTHLEAFILLEILPSSPRIINLINFHFEIPTFDDREADNLVQFFEYCPGGDLHHLLSGGFKVPEDFAWHCFIQIAEALDVIHNCGSEIVVHADIKPANIFLSQKYHHEPPWPNLILGDFGLAVLNRGEDRGTPEWQGPEVGYNSRAGDIWSLGAIIHNMCHGNRTVVPHPPASFPGTKKEWLLLPEARQPKPLPRRYSGELNNCMMSCLALDPRDRISSRELVRLLKRVRSRQRRRGR